VKVGGCGHHFDYYQKSRENCKKPQESLSDISGSNVFLWSVQLCKCAYNYDLRELNIILGSGKFP
jgi:hypothetical protein